MAAVKDVIESLAIALCNSYIHLVRYCNNSLGSVSSLLIHRRVKSRLVAFLDIILFKEIIFRETKRVKNSN